MMVVMALVTLLAANEEYTRPFQRNIIGPEPKQAHTDLGPIVVPVRIKKGKELEQYLHTEAKRLGADGFYVTGLTERQSSAQPTPPGGVDPWSNPDPLDRGAKARQEASYTSPGVDAEAMLVLGTALALTELVRHELAKGRPTKNSTIHAFTYRALPAETRAALSAIASDALAGRLSIAEFELRRSELLASPSGDDPP